MRPRRSRSRWPCRRRCLGLLAVQRPFSGQCEEDVVEGGPADPQIIDRDASCLETTTCLKQKVRASARRHIDDLSFNIGVRRRLGERSEKRRDSFEVV